MNDENENLEQLAFDEEARCLEEVEMKIDEIIRPRAERIESIERELCDWHATDYDDIARKQTALRTLERDKKKVAEVEAHKATPYFCHFEASADGGDTRVFFVGEKAVGSSGKTIVLDWRSPLGRTYRNKSQRTIEVTAEDGEKTHTYDLRLRRMVHIKNATLKSVVTEYDTAASSLDGEIVDPFLLSVLKDKRRNYRLSDIIKTIQQNQNEILELPLDKSFIVQGCAGSGKTMILLHRLSYLAFNHPEVDFEKYIVLTPNESFNAHIDELCDQLELGNIARMTVEDYYLRICNLLSRGDTYVEEAGVSKTSLSKIGIDSLMVEPDRRASKSLLTIVYSLQFRDELLRKFRNMTATAMEELSECNVVSMFAKNGFDLASASETPYELYKRVATSCARIRRENASAERQADTASRNHAAVAPELQQALDEYDSAVNLVEALVEPARKEIEGKTAEAYAALDSMQSALDSLKAELAHADQSLESAAAAKSAATEAYSATNKMLEEATAAANTPLNPKDFINDDNVVASARADCKKEIEVAEKLEDELRQTGRLNFGRRRKLREQMHAAINALEDALRLAKMKHAEQVVQSLVDQHAQALEHAKLNLESTSDRLQQTTTEENRLAQECEALRLRVAEKEGERNRLEVEAKTLSDCREAFNSSEYPALEDISNIGQIHTLPPAAAAYLATCKGLSSDQKRSLRHGKARISHLEAKLDQAEQTLREAQESILPENDVASLESAEAILHRLDVRTYKNLLDDSLAGLEEEQIPSSKEGRVFRYKLYLLALLCLAYYGTSKTLGYCACIDEAQDLSEAELALVKESLGDNGILNLYGDTRQLIHAHRGISSWDSISKKHDCSVYVLNENYRNTLEVTSYCNKRLDLNITGVGLNGSKVTECPLRSATDNLFQLRSANEGSRCAVIYKSGLSGAKDALIELLGDDASWGKVDAGKISVINVEAAKGLEFDVVIVLENGMTENELYIAATRALDNLFVVNLPGSSISETDEIADGIELVANSEKEETPAVKIKAKRFSAKTAANEAPEEPEPEDLFFDIDFS